MATTLPVLRIWVNPAVEGLRALYEQHIETHNKHILEDPHPNSGFDLFIPTKQNFVHYSGDTTVSWDVMEDNKSRLVNHEIKAAMYDPQWRRMETQTSCAYYLYPRSSIYKTPLMLANSVGIIDSGYRGWICSALRFLPREEDRQDRHTGEYRYAIEQNTKLTQICHPNLVPFLVELVDDEAVLETTTRGEGGFGSTGR